MLGTGEYPTIGRGWIFRVPQKYPTIGRGSDRLFLQNILLSVAPRLSDILLSVAGGDQFPAKYPTIGRAISYYRSRQPPKISYYRSRVGHFDAQISYYRSRVRSKTELRFNTLQPFLGP